LAFDHAMAKNASAWFFGNTLNMVKAMNFKFDLTVLRDSQSHRASHRKDMSPLTQGLNYRSVCD